MSDHDPELERANRTGVFRRPCRGLANAGDKITWDEISWAMCLSCTSGGVARPLKSASASNEGVRIMKKLAVVMAALMAVLSVAGCAGKGKAPPPPVVTKG